jgi:prepilin-type N-terminal cleavage/methylation domain-containing protein
MTTPFTISTRRRGVTLVELLISLAISAALLSATGIAIDASFKAYSANQITTELTQRTRVALHRILSELRTTAEHEPLTADQQNLFATGVESVDSGIIMYRADGSELRFHHDATERQLIATLDGAQHVLLKGVTAFEVRLTPMWITSDGNSRIRLAVLQRASVLITVETHGEAADVSENRNPITVTLSASAMPRQHVW